MRRGAANAPASGVGVLDAGVVLTRLDHRRPRHADVCALFDRAGRRLITLWISVVNLAEVLEHSAAYTRATGLDPVALLDSFQIEIHCPDAQVARAVARLAEVADLSLADRFAAATSQALGARLHTTDPVLADAARRRRMPVTRYD